MDSWWVYIVRNGNGQLYTGITTNVARRVKQHQLGSGAKALRGKGPIELMWSETVGDRSDASKIEYAILSKTCRGKALKSTLAAC